MKGGWALVLAPVLGLASLRGIAAMVLAILGANWLDRSWRGLGHWWLPVALYLVIYLLLLFWEFIRSRRGRDGSGTQTPSDP